MAVVKEGKIGNCTYKIYDDYIRSPEEIQKILERCGEIMSRAYMRIALEKAEKEAKKTAQ